MNFSIPDGGDKNKLRWEMGRLATRYSPNTPPETFHRSRGTLYIRQSYLTCFFVKGTHCPELLIAGGRVYAGNLA